MKKLLISLYSLILLSACSLFPSLSPKEEVFVITDRDSNQILSTYEYDYSQKNPLIRTETYDEKQRISRIRDYSYDDQGYVSRITEVIPNASERVIDYSTTEIKDSSGRISRVLQTSSQGETVETFYGYDEEGTLRGTVIRTDGDSIMMKDYDDGE